MQTSVKMNDMVEKYLKKIDVSLDMGTASGSEKWTSIIEEYGFKSKYKKETQMDSK